MLIEAWGKEVQRKLETVGFQQCFGLEGRLFVCRYQAKSSQVNTKVTTFFQLRI